MEKQQFIQAIQREIAHTLGRRYLIDFNAMDVQTLREFLRLMKDFQFEVDNHARAAVRKQPWKFLR